MSGYQGLTDAELMQRLALAQASPGPSVSPPQPVSNQPLPPAPGAQVAPGFNADLSKLSDEQLTAAAANVDPHMSTAEDMGRSSVTALERSAGGLATWPGNLVNLYGHGMETLLHHGVGAIQDAAGYTGGNPAFPYMGKNAKGPFPQINYAHANNLPDQSDADALAQQTAGPYHTPQTAGGRYAARISEMAPMALSPGSIPARLAAVLAPAVVSQGAEDLAPDKYKGLAGFAGAMAGGGLANAGTRVMHAPEAAMGGAMGDLTDSTILQAQALRQSAASKGIDLTLPEAVQQVTGNATGLGRMQRVVESTKQGQAMMAPYFADRPAQVSNAAHSLADLIAPEATQPGMIGQRAQEAASGALDKARQTVNGIAGPDYAALPNQMMDPAQYAPLAANPSYKAALAQLREHPELGATVAHLPDNNLAVINEVKKRLATMGEQAQGTPMVPGDNQLAGLRFGAKADTDALARQASPEYANANDTVANLSQQYVDPLKAGPLGKISQTGQVTDQAAALYPRSPPEGAANETRQAVGVLGATAPGVADDLTRQHLINTLNDSMKNLQGGQNQYAGAKYAVLLAAHPEQAAALRAGLSALPHGAERAQQMDDLLEAMRATGKRQQPGSMTAFNTADLKELHIAPFAQALGRIGDPLTWGAGIGDMINQANYRRNIKSLADMMLAPPEETAAVLQKAKKATPKNGASALVPALLQGGRP